MYIFYLNRINYQNWKALFMRIVIAQLLLSHHRIRLVKWTHINFTEFVPNLNLTTNNTNIWASSHYKLAKRYVGCFSLVIFIFVSSSVLFLRQIYFYCSFIFSLYILIFIRWSIFIRIFCKVVVKILVLVKQICSNFLQPKFS